MKNKKGNIAMITLIIVIVAITVGVIGFMFAKRIETPVAPVANQQPLPTVQTQPATGQQPSVQRVPLDLTNSYDTSKWITYTNEKYGYSFKYPNTGWYIYGGTDNNGQTSQFDKNEKDKLKDADWISVAMISSQDASQTIAVEPQRDAQLKAEQFLFSKDDKAVDVTFLNTDAVLSTHSAMTADGKKDLDFKDIYFNKNGFIFNLGGVAKDYAQNRKIDTGIFNALFSTFKFTDAADETANWQTYKNTKFGFEIKYPKEAIVIPAPHKGVNGLVYIGTNNSGLNEYNYGVTFDTMGAAKGLSAENWYSQYYEKKKQEASMADVPFHLAASGQGVILDEYQTYKTSDFNIDSSIINYFIVHDDSIFRLSYEDQSANDSNWNEHEKITNQIFSTFKFTN